jgi:GxxExxY protein
MRDSNKMLHCDVTEMILGACFTLEAELGSGFLESVYEKSLALALRQKGLKVQCQHPVKVMFRGECVGEFFADLLVEGRVIVELKAVKALAPEHMAQVINYLNATGLDVGLLVNFGMPKIEYRRFFRKATENEQGRTGYTG